jgi:hypothetical protein
MDAVSRNTSQRMNDIPEGPNDIVQQKCVMVLVVMVKHPLPNYSRKRREW